MPKNFLSAKNIKLIFAGIILDACFALATLPDEVQSTGILYVLPMFYIGVIICSVHLAIIPNLQKPYNLKKILALTIGTWGSVLVVGASGILSFLICTGIGFVLLILQGVFTISLYSVTSTSLEYSSELIGTAMLVFLMMVGSSIAAGLSIYECAKIQNYFNKSFLLKKEDLPYLGIICGIVGYVTLLMDNFFLLGPTYVVATILAGLPMTYYYICAESKNDHELTS